MDKARLWAHWTPNGGIRYRHGVKDWTDDAVVVAKCGDHTPERCASTTFGIVDDRGDRTNMIPWDAVLLVGLNPTVQSLNRARVSTATADVYMHHLDEPWPVTGLIVHDTVAAFTPPHGRLPFRRAIVPRHNIYFIEYTSPHLHTQETPQMVEAPAMTAAAGWVTTNGTRLPAVDIDVQDFGVEFTDDTARCWYPWASIDLLEVDMDNTDIEVPDLSASPPRTVDAEVCLSGFVAPFRPLVLWMHRWAVSWVDADTNRYCVAPSQNVTRVTVPNVVARG